MLQHVALEVREADAHGMLAFLALLGFEPVEPPATLAGRTAWAQRAGTQVHLLLTGDPVVPPEGHTAVVLDDYEASLETLREAGHDVEPRQEHWGAPRAFVTAPAGHRFEVMAAPPPD